MAPPTGGYSDDRDLRPHRGGAVLALGIIGLVVCFICGIIAIVMGSSDLKAMKAGEMDPAGEGQTRAGLICGIIGVAWLVLVLVLVFAGVMAAPWAVKTTYTYGS